MFVLGVSPRANVKGRQTRNTISPNFKRGLRQYGPTIEPADDLSMAVVSLRRDSETYGGGVSRFSTLFAIGIVTCGMQRRIGAVAWEANRAALTPP
jgi:hypothetical protein